MTTGLPLTCCQHSSWVAETDVGSAHGFDLMLGKCGRCKTPWMNVFCSAASTGGYEPVSREDAEKMRAIRDPQELKAFVRRWAESHGLD